MIALWLLSVDWIEGWDMVPFELYTLVGLDYLVVYSLGWFSKRRKK